MKEELLHFLWKTKRIDFADLSTLGGEKIQVINLGNHNHNAGPDFLNAQLRIGTTLWNGHVEIHIKASEWNHHKHQHDPAYNNVILHVVYQADKKILNEKGHTIPTLELKNKIKPTYFKAYNKLLGALSWIPCDKHFKDLNKDKLPFFLERLVTIRLIRKQSQIEALLKTTKNDWEEVLYILLMKYLGLKVNAEAFERLSEVLPFSILKKQTGNITQKESLLLGQAGLLRHSSGGIDAYIEQLSKEYKHQKAKYNLVPMTGVEWRFSKLRPANFPSIRIAQLAAIYDKTPKLFAELITRPTISKVNVSLNVAASSYWDTHYLPGKASIKKQKKIGQTTKDLLVINVIAPLVFTYGCKISDEELKERAIDLLFAVPAEKNKILRKWQDLGVKANSSAQSQALIELKTNYCDKQKCLECEIGQQIILA